MNWITCMATAGVYRAAGHLTMAESMFLAAIEAANLPEEAMWARAEIDRLHAGMERLRKAVDGEE